MLLRFHILVDRYFPKGSSFSTKFLKTLPRNRTASCLSICERQRPTNCVSGRPSFPMTNIRQRCTYINSSAFVDNRSFVVVTMTKEKSSKAKKKKKIEKTFQKVRILSVATPSVRKKLIREGNTDVIDCIAECCLNILNGNVPLTGKQQAFLRKRKSKLRAIVDKKVSLKKKKEIIQKGGFPLGAILAPVAAFLGSMLLHRRQQ